MIGGVTRLGGLPGLPGRIALSARVAFCHVNDSRWGNTPSRGRVHVTFNCLWRRLCIIKRDSKKPQHWNVAARADNERKRTLTANMRRSPSIFSVYMLATTQQRLVTSPRDPGDASHFSTTARQVTSPTRGPPPPCKQALKFPLAKKWFLTRNNRLGQTCPLSIHNLFWLYRSLYIYYGVSLIDLWSRGNCYI